MFDALKNLGNIGEMMKQARQIQEKMAAMKDDLARRQVTADSGAGMVQATVNGNMELVGIKIDKTKVNLNDVEMLEDLVTAAVHAAQTKAAEMMREEMRKATADMGLPPGLLP